VLPDYSFDRPVSDRTYAGKETGAGMGANGYFDELDWRAALEKKGADWVARELGTRPGQPGDELLDVVYKRPYPTREFCQRWCDQEKRTFSMSPTTIGIIASVAAVLILSRMAISSVEHYQPSHPGAAPPSLQAHKSADPVVSSVNQGPTTSLVSKPRSSCAYVTYPTADCKTPAH
jgi:hypothetical protein